MSKTNKRLGRGLSSLISADLTKSAEDRAVGSNTLTEGQESGTTSNMSRSILDVARSGVSRFLMIPLDKIRQNPMQPRRAFDEKALQVLAESLKRCGTLQPIVVRPIGDGYELVAGERRLRSAAIAGIKEMPAVVRAVPDDQLLELALVENIQRTDLNPVERAMGYQQLQQRYGLTHEEIADRLGEERVTITNYLRLLTLDSSILEMIAAGSLTAGHAKAILGITDPKMQIQVAHRVIQDGWSVRRAESEVARQRRDRAEAKQIKPKRPAVADLEELLIQELGVPVRIQEGRRRHQGKLIIAYSNLDDFDRILHRLGVSVEAMRG